MNDKTDQSQARSDQGLAWIKRQFLSWQVIGLVATTGLAIYIYFASQKAPEVSYQISVVQVFNAEASSQSIVLTDLTGRKIESNVFAAEIVIWNSGSAPVEKANVRQPIKIKATDGAGILGYEFLSENKAGVSRFTVGKTSLEKPTSQEFEFLSFKKQPLAPFQLPFSLSELDVGWQFFDDGHGFRVRVIYMADSYTRLTVVGNVYPSGDVVDRSIGTSTSNRPMAMRVINVVILIGTFVFVFVAINIATFRVLYSRFQKKKNHFIWVVQILILAGWFYGASLFGRMILPDIRTLVPPPL